MFDPQSKEIFGSNYDRLAAVRAEAVGSTTEGVSFLDSTGRPISWNNRADQMYSCESSPVDMMEGVEVNSGAPVSEDDLVKRAEAYQQYMKKIEVPRNRGSLIPFTTWMGLGKSIKQLYGQPLHYLTNITLQQLDQKRFGSEDEYMPLDLVLHPCKAEAMIWLMEEVHRNTSSHLYIAERWKSDPFYHAFLDSVLLESSN